MLVEHDIYRAHRAACRGSVGRTDVLLSIYSRDLPPRRWRYTLGRDPAQRHRPRRGGFINLNDFHIWRARCGHGRGRHECLPPLWAFVP